MIKVAVQTLILILLVSLTWIGCQGDPGNPFDDDDDQPGSDDPTRYHGDQAQDPFFEGWYLNVKDPAQGSSHLLIIAVLNPNRTSGAWSTAYALLADMNRGSYLMQLFDPLDFNASSERFDASIADRLSIDFSGTSGCIEADGHSACWQLELTNWMRWTNAMGSLTNVPDLAMNWDVWMLNGRAGGYIEYDGQRTDYFDATAYGDHNWGTQFPDTYVWGQANNFATAGDCLAFSGGDVPLGDIPLRGYMIGYLRGDRLYELRSQDGDLINHSYQDGIWVVEGIEGNHKLVITGVADTRTIVRLPAPRPEGLSDYAGQTLKGTVTVEVFERDGLGWKIVDSNASSPAGLENGGS
ncbi:MAG: tocopherol cyclase family protein [Candidatus Alcyoniella australis]|nr:tocopherol cyclase family protein [Candidatus Alcyoniella australis]